jgi:predicted O-methyltransferase YrrM
MYASEPQMGTNGEMHAIDTITRIPYEEGLFLKQTHQAIRPALSVEVGLAYGFSTVYILSAMKDGNYGHHIAIDPLQTRSWHGVGVQKAVELGMGEHFELIEFELIGEDSAHALLRLAKAKRKAQFIFIDGGHRFDNVIVDFLFGDRILDQGGWMIFDALWLPAIQKVCAYVESNRTEYEPCSCPIASVIAFRKVGKDCRDWRHYVDF